MTEFPSLLCHTFLTHDFLGVRQMRGGLFRPRLAPMVSVDRPSRDTIPLFCLVQISTGIMFNIYKFTGTGMFQILKQK
jgi:hypothetical protein